MLTDDQRRIALDVLRETRAIGDVAGSNEQEIRALIGEYLLEKAALGPSTVPVKIRSGAIILRDERGIPHIHAGDPYDLFFAHGYAQAQDRLWQLDFLRRQAHGRLHRRPIACREDSAPSGRCAR